MRLSADRLRLKTRWLYLGVLSLGYSPLAVLAEAPAGAIEQHAEPGLVLGAKLGLGSGKPINDFALRYGAELELGYLLPLPAPAHHALEVFVGAGFEAASASGATAEGNARLPDAAPATYKIRERALPWSAGLRWRVPLVSQRWAPYLAAGYRGVASWDTVHTLVSGKTTGDHVERNVAHGFFAGAGVELFVGPGALFGEAQLALVPRDGQVLRDAAVSGIAAYLGYRLMFGAPEPTPAPLPAAQPDPAPPAPPPSPPEPVPPPSAETPPAPDAADATSSAQEAATATTELTSQIRGMVRAFDGQPLRASVRVQPGDLSAETDADGRFSLNVPPGKYTVTLQADGYSARTQSCVVDEAGITVLNVELRDE
jgi:hypothetical protein